MTVSIDLLSTVPSSASFSDRVKRLELSNELQDKVLNQQIYSKRAGHLEAGYPLLTRKDEQELATEMLLYRYKFTETVYRSTLFRQAALTVIQNIYLFQNRKIFLKSSAATPELERQEALLLFSCPVKAKGELNLEKTFQHSILARIWNRITSNQQDNSSNRQEFIELQTIVEELNTLRNIYMILCQGLVRKLVTHINSIYRQSISFDDAIQIGEFGIARASYRYHVFSGVRFSTYASKWVFKEIQRQALGGRLIKISANTVERYAKAAKENSPDLQKIKKEIKGKTALCQSTEFNILLSEQIGPVSSPTENALEKKQLQKAVLQAIDKTLNEKSGDILKRRYGLPPYQSREQSVMKISKIYGVTRGAIYQLEQTALKKLSACLDKSLF